MLDVHLPHKAIEGFREFFIHLFTITMGLLIATQIESCMEWRHHVHVAEEARASLRAEIQKNLNDLKQLLPGLKKWRDQVDADLAVMERIQEHPEDRKNQHAKWAISFSAVTMSDTAWRTAQSTGALAYMPYEEAERYTEIYQAQDALMALEDKPFEDVAAINGLLAKYNSRSSHGSKITREQASALAEKLGAMQMHLSVGSGLLQEDIELSQAFLENREPKHEFGEPLK
jgi:uncharacterized membrane protein YccC